MRAMLKDKMTVENDTPCLSGFLGAGSRPYQRPFDDIGIDHELIRLGRRETIVATAQLHPLYGRQRSAPIAPYRKRPRPNADQR